MVSPQEQDLNCPHNSPSCTIETALARPRSFASPRPLARTTQTRNETESDFPVGGRLNRPPNLRTWRFKCLRLRLGGQHKDHHPFFCCVGGPFGRSPMMAKNASPLREEYSHFHDVLGNPYKEASPLIDKKASCPAGNRNAFPALYLHMYTVLFCCTAWRW